MLATVDYSIDRIKDEARYLVERGIIDRHQPIHALGQFFSQSEWALIECELEANSYSLMTNCINDLLDKN